ncbi:hypothetical protein ACI2KR_27160 [Pseudomonas luteola]
MIVPKSLDNIYCHIKRIADSGKDFKPGSTLRITLDKCREAVSTMLSKPISSGKYCVEYADGRKTEAFDYKTAKEYAKIFNGKVVHLDSARVCWPTVRD